MSPTLTSASIDDYLMDTEDILCSTAVTLKQAGQRNDSGGDLACTRNRLVYVDEGKAIDIDLESINSIEYHAASMMNRGATLSFVAAAFSAIVWFALPGLDSLRPIAALIAVGGFLVMLYFILTAKSMLLIRTPSHTYEFLGADRSSMAAVPHAVRGATA